MAVTLRTPGPEHIGDVVRALAPWQRDADPAQLHPGDVGWFQRHGADTLAGALRVWERDGVAAAVGLLDGPGLVRLGIDPALADDEELAGRIADDVQDPSQGVLPAGEACLEARTARLLDALLRSRGWSSDEPWSTLARDLTDPVPRPELRIEVLDAAASGAIQERVAVQRSAFANSTFTRERWETMAAGPAYGEARCLLGFDGDGQPVAAATVWSAGPGRPGLLEPVAVRRDRQGRGHGTAIVLAAAYLLRELGSSSALVCTPSSNTAAVAAYASAGLTLRHAVRDLCRPAADPAADPQDDEAR